MEQNEAQKQVREAYKRFYAVQQQIFPVVKPEDAANVRVRTEELAAALRALEVSMRPATGPGAGRTVWAPGEPGTLDEHVRREQERGDKQVSPVPGPPAGVVQLAAYCAGRLTALAERKQRPQWELSEIAAILEVLRQIGPAHEQEMQKQYDRLHEETEIQ